jgi:hypothetical protein
MEDFCTLEYLAVEICTNLTNEYQKDKGSLEVKKKLQDLY